MTVPQCLEILMMSPRRQDWASKIRYVIFDEVSLVFYIPSPRYDLYVMLSYLENNSYAHYYDHKITV